MTEHTPAAGKGTLFKDSKFGNAVNSAVTAALLYIGAAVGKVDVTPLPDALEPLAVAAVALVSGLLVSKATARR